MDLGTLEKQRLVNQNDSFHEIQDAYRHSSTFSLMRSRSLVSGGLILIVSLLVNAVCFKTIYSLSRERTTCKSEYTGLEYTTPTSYHVYTDYIHENRSVSDLMWESLSSSPIMVALDTEYTRNHNLVPSIAFPWDQSKGLFHIKAFHHIHCLKNIRHAYYEALASDPSSKPLIPPSHVAHCLDTIRQDMMCHADDTPMPTINERHKIGDNQMRMCKDWDALVSWTQAPERQACFKMIDEYRRVPNSLEEFAFCPEGSPYQPTMDSYFAKWGHKDPYAES